MPVEKVAITMVSSATTKLWTILRKSFLVSQVTGTTQAEVTGSYDLQIQDL